MRILVVNNFFPPRVGGSSHLAEALAKGYAAAGHDVLVLTAAFGDAPPEEYRDGIRIVRFPSVMLPESRFAVSFDLSFTTRPGLYRNLGTLLGEFRPDVIHQHGQFMDLTWATGEYARRQQIPTLISIHTRLENPTALYRNVFQVLDRLLVKPLMKRHAPRLVVMDTHMSDYIESRYRGAYRDLVAIPVGVDPDWVRGGSRAAGRAFLQADDRPVILSVGHVIPLRDRVGLIEALPKVLEKHPDVLVAIVGKIYYSQFEQRALDLDVTRAVRAIGPVAKSAIPDLMAAADVECHEQGDGLGTATLEAMAAGLPVVGWGRNDNFPGLELVEGRDILLAPRGDVDGLADRLIEVLDDPTAARAIGERAALIVDRNFSLDRVVAQHLETLHDLTT